MDAVVTDPPAGISFMGASWDTFPTRAPRAKASFRDGRKRLIHDGPEFDSTPRARDGFIAFLSAVMSECLRVLKPGGHALVWALPRTSHWTATAIEEAGFDIREVITHLFGSGFPKSLSVDKAIDKAAGAERPIVGPKVYADGTTGHWGLSEKYAQDAHTKSLSAGTPKLETLAATDAARKWSGYGTALKPAQENWILARKPLGESTVAANVLAHGTGALNIDGCRVGYSNQSDKETAFPGGKVTSRKVTGGGLGCGQKEHDRHEVAASQSPLGRWPANVVLSHSSLCKCIGTKKVQTGVAVNRNRTTEAPSGNAVFSQRNVDPGGDATYADPDGTETVEAWECVENCPVRLLDAQSGTLTSGVMVAGTKRTQDGGYHGNFPEIATAHDTPADSGGASRFFYCAKPSTAEREEGLAVIKAWHALAENKRQNIHPCVKSVALMRWLCRLVTPPKGTLLDPFMGSGSTGVAAIREGFNFIGIERDAAYFEIAKARIQHVTKQGKLF